MRMMWTWHVARIELIRAQTILVGRPEEKGLRKHTCTWKDNIKMTIGWGGSRTWTGDGLFSKRPRTLAFFKDEKC
jgi:hypothetical protein